MPITNTDLDKRLSLQEQEIKYVREDVTELKVSMKEHMDKSEVSNNKLHSKLDMMIWTALVALAGFVVKIVFF